MKRKVILGLVLVLSSCLLFGCEQEQSLQQPKLAKQATVEQVDRAAVEQGCAMLDGIKRGVQPGTAGCSLKLLQTTVRAYQWAVTTTLTPTQISSLRAEYVAALSPEEAQLFRRQLEDVAYEYASFLEPAKAQNNVARLADVNMNEQDITFPVQRQRALEALLQQ